jgi:hypothetical protein
MRNSGRFHLVFLVFRFHPKSARTTGDNGRTATDKTGNRKMEGDRIIGQKPVTPGPNYDLDPAPHPAVLGRNGKVYVGTMHGQAFNNAAAENGGSTGVVGSGEVTVDVNGNIISSTIKPIVGR